MIRCNRGNKKYKKAVRQKGLSKKKKKRVQTNVSSIRF